MMNKIILLTKLLLKSHISTLSTRNMSKRAAKQTSPILYLIIIGFVVLSYCVPMTMVFGEFISQLGGVLNPSILLELLFPAITIALLVISVLYIISYYYLSTDITTLLPLPLKPYEILLARFFVVVIYQYLLEFFFFGPVLIGYGIGTNGGPLFFVLLILIMLILPVIPVAIMSIFITTLMRFGNITKRKDSFTYFVLFLSTGLGVSISILSNRVVDFTNVDPNQITDLSQYIGKITNYVFPFLRPAISALTDPSAIMSILYFLLYIVISAVVIFLFTLVANKVYLKGVMGGGETKARKREHNKKINEKITKKSNVFNTYALKEWRIMVRTPIYNMNLILVNVIMFVVIGISFSATFSQAQSPELNEFLNNIINLRFPKNNSSVLFFIISGIIFFNGISMIASTAISRDGSNAWFMKYIPLKPIVQINAKIFFGVVINIIFPLVVALACIAVGIIDIIDFIAIILPILLLSILLNYGGILIDLSRPKLNWDNETIAVKQNLNGVIYMLGTWFLAGLLLVSGFLIMASNDIAKNWEQLGWIDFSFVVIISGVALIVLSLLVLMKKAASIKSLLIWSMVISICSYTLIFGLLAIFMGITVILNNNLNIVTGAIVWSIIISLAILTAIMILYKGIVNKGDSILENID